MEIKFHFVREQVTKGHIDLTYCPTEEMVADVLTKSLPASKFTELRSSLGLTRQHPEEECWRYQNAVRSSEAVNQDARSGARQMTSLTDVIT